MIRIGFLDYINSLPVYYDFMNGKVTGDYKLVKGKPSELNGKIRLGRLEISPVSSYEYAVNWRKYFILPGICLNSINYAKSVLLISKYPIRKLDGKTISLSNTSATSAMALKVLLKDRFGLKNKFIVCKPVLAEMMKKSDACLIIGDEALSVNVPRKYYVYDLGSVWKKTYGHSIVFAIWVVRRRFFNSDRKTAREFHRIILNSLSHGLKNLDIIALMIRTEKKDIKINSVGYFKNLGYRLDESMKAGLIFFYNKLNKCGFTDEHVKLEFMR